MFNNKWRFLSDASYWIYIAHLPVVTIVSFYLLEFSIPIEIKFIISIIATLALSLITYIFFVRGTALGLILNGKRRSSSRWSFVICLYTIAVIYTYARANPNHGSGWGPVVSAVFKTVGGILRIPRWVWLPCTPAKASITKAF